MSAAAAGTPACLPQLAHERNLDTRLLSDDGRQAEWLMVAVLDDDVRLRGDRLLVRLDHDLDPVSASDAILGTS
jgi:hypothetical protein